jgi:hypothetical protein
MQSKPVKSGVVLLVLTLSAACAQAAINGQTPATTSGAPNSTPAMEANQSTRFGNGANDAISRDGTTPSPVSANYANAAPMSPSTAAQERSAQTATQATPKLREEIRNELTMDGLRDIKIAPEEYVVHAKNKNGDSVVMVIRPNSFLEMTDVKVGNSTSTLAKRAQVEPDPTPLWAQK